MQRDSPQRWALLRSRCGLSITEAAEFHNVSLNTVTSWSSGRRRAPPGALQELRALYRKIERAANEAVDLAGHARGTIEIGLATDDHDAQSLGWPCVGAHEAVIGILAARLDCDVVVVPRGSTPATAAAVAAHKKSPASR